MIAGKTLNELAEMISKQKTAKKDFIADTRRATFGVSQTRLELGLEGIGFFEPTQLFHDQVGTKLGIPAKYYDRMLSQAPDLLATNVNRWFDQQPEKRLIRTIGNQARAFLSDRYRPMDYDEMLEAVVPALAEIPEVEIRSCEITEKRLYIHAISKAIEVPVSPKPGDRLRAGVLIRNSEVGCGALSITPMVEFLICTNGAVISEGSFRKNHLGRVQGDGGEDVYESFKDDTRIASDKALWLQVRDVVSASMNEALLMKVRDKSQEQKSVRIVDPIKTVNFTSKRFGLSEKENGQVMRHLIEGADLSIFGLNAAITRTAQDSDSYDRAVDLEVLGGDLIEAPRSTWESLALAN